MIGKMEKKSKEEILQLIKDSDLTSRELDMLLMQLSHVYRDKLEVELFNVVKGAVKKLQLENKNLKERLKEKSKNESGTL